MTDDKDLDLLLDAARARSLASAAMETNPFRARREAAERAAAGAGRRGTSAPSIADR